MRASAETAPFAISEAAFLARRQVRLGRVHHDIRYAEQWTLALDLYILAMTPLSLLKAKRAAL